MKQIFEAIANLPEELITPEIAAAGIEEKDIRLLNHLPEKYLTLDVIFKLVTDNESYGTFDLSRIPLQARSEKVCECAVKRNFENFRHVPDDVKNSTMVSIVLESSNKAFHLLPLIPTQLWTPEFAYHGINSIRDYSSFYNYSRSSRYSSNSYSSSEKLKQVEILLSHIPERIKNQEFYLGFFFYTRLSIEHIMEIIPDEFKQEEYYHLLAMQDFDKVPENKYSYYVFMAALSPDAKTSKRKILYDEDVFDTMLPVMDEKMADLIVCQSQSGFKKLPMKFRTVKRLLFTIENMDGYNSHNPLLHENDEILLTAEVCRAFIKKNMGYPVFPENIWDEDFIKYCLEYGHSFEWFEQMPQRLQTNEIVKQSIGYSIHKIIYARTDLIDTDTAAKVFRASRKSGYSFEEYIPAMYFEEFTMLTGLTKEFFGGETSLSELKANKESYTYCKLGHSYIGFYSDGNYRNSNTYLILTRRTSLSVQPVIVFDTRIGTYHSTWLEKIIADYDSGFIKPNVSKNLKALQINSYYNMEFIETYKGVQLYNNILLGERINYIGCIDGQVISCRTKDEIIQSIDNSINL